MLVEPREPGVILRELCVLLSRRPILTKDLFELVEEGALAEYAKVRIFGAVEFVIAEALARLLGAKLAVGGADSGLARFVKWNGAVDAGGAVPVFEMACPGLPDVEYHYGDQCDMVEVTLGRGPATRVAELGELARHRCGPTVANRVLLAPWTCRGAEEYERLASRMLGVKVRILPLQLLPRFLRDGRVVGSLDDLATAREGLCEGSDPCEGLEQLAPPQGVMGKPGELVEWLRSQNLAALASIVYAVWVERGGECRGCPAKR